MKSLKRLTCLWLLLISLITVAGCGSGSGGSGNSGPVANAGIDQSVATGDTVTLDGSASTGDSLTYSWTLAGIPTGSTAALLNSTTATPTFTADLEGAYIASLIVNDGSADSLPDTITVIATTANAIPMAHAGDDMNVLTGETVVLDGSASTDAEDDPLTYLWTLADIPTGSSAALLNATTASPTFTADLEGAYIANLIVNDSHNDSAPDAIIVNARTAANEGTVATPVALTLSTPYFGVVGDAVSYYKVDPVTAGTAYSVRLSDLTDDVDLYVYDNDGSYGTTAKCQSTLSGTQAEACSLIASGPALYIATDGFNTTGGYSIVVDPLPTLEPEGLSTAPVNITNSLPYSGMVNTSESYYIANVTQGQTYAISITGLTDDADLYVYGADSTFSTVACQYTLFGPAGETCVVAAEGPGMYLMVDGQFTSLGALFTLDLAVSPNAAEGDALAPLAISALPHSGTVDNSRSYYSIPVTQDSTYIVSLSGLSADADLYVYDNDSTFSTVDCQSSSLGTDSEACSFTAAGTTLYVMVDGQYALGGTSFELDVALSPYPAEGTALAPLTLASLPHSGTVDTTESYYSITVTSGLSYDISLTGLTGDVDLYVYTDQFSTLGCSSFNLDLADEVCSVTPTTTQLFIKADGQWSRIGAGFSLGAALTP